MAKPVSFEDYVKQQSDSYASQSYTGYEPSTGTTERTMTQPAPAPASSYQPTYDDPYSSGDAYSTGTGPAQQDAWSAPAPEYQFSATEPALVYQPASQATTYQPASSDPYHTGNAYSTGPDNPYGVWRPRQLPPPTSPYDNPEAVRAANQQAAIEQADYAGQQYALGHAHSTSQAYTGMTSSGNPAPENPMAWNVELARQAGAPPPVEPLAKFYGEDRRQAMDRRPRQRVWGSADDPVRRPDGTLKDTAFWGQTPFDPVAWPTYEPERPYDGMGWPTEWAPWYGEVGAEAWAAGVRAPSRRDFFAYPPAAGSDR